MKSYRDSDKSRVFVVHGRNEKMRRALFDFLRAIDLKPIEWSEAVALTGKPSPFVGEILDAAMQYAQAIIVLFTGDDQARLRDEFLWVNDPAYEREATPQSRPNVIFEAGYGVGKISRAHHPGPGWNSQTVQRHCRKAFHPVEKLFQVQTGIGAAARTCRL